MVEVSLTKVLSVVVLLVFLQLLSYRYTTRNSDTSNTVKSLASEPYSGGDLVVVTSSPLPAEMHALPRVMGSAREVLWLSRFTPGAPSAPLVPCETLQDDPCFSGVLSRVPRPLQDHQGSAASRNAHLENVAALFAHRPELKRKMAAIVRRIHIGDTVLVMPLNRGYLDLFLNWWASARLASVDTGNLLVFPADRALHERLLELGFNSFFHESLGDFPADSSRVFGDPIFVRMMWLKTVSVWLVLDAGKNVLFQDVDVVWFTNPMNYILDNRWMRFKVTGDLDAVFMDDGSRSDRYEPYYANTGFFFLRGNAKVRSFWDTVLFNSDLTMHWRSQQQTVNHFLRASCSLGMKINVLCSNVFAHGKTALHVEKGKIPRDAFIPVVWHVNYTPNKAVKLQRMIDLNLWYLDTAVWPLKQDRQNVECNCSESGREFSIKTSDDCEHLKANCVLVKRLY